MALKKLNEAEILRQLEATDLGKKPEDVYTNFITDISNELIKEFREYLRDNTRGSGTLAQSVVATPNRQGFSIDADFYYKFIDEGVNAAPRQQGLRYVRPLQQNSPYSFKHLGVSKEMERSIAAWSGVSIGQAYGIAISIKKHGIKGKSVTDNVITDEVLERIAEDLTTITGLSVGVSFDKNLVDRK